MRALVTGDLGFVGRHLRPELDRRGYEVLGLDVKRGPHEDVRDWFRSHGNTFDLVIHLAAVVGGRQLIEGSPLAVAVDLAIDAELFGWALRARPGRVVYFSSSAAYPVQWQTPGSGIRLYEDLIDLDAVESPDLTYGWAKLTGEILASHARRAGVPVTVVRPFSGYGADQDPDYPFRAFLDRAAARADPFDVWGDGEQVRDFVHIDDIVRLTLDAAEDGIDGPLNLGTGIGTSFNRLAELVTREAGYTPLIRHLPAEPVGVQYRVADTTRADALVGRPAITLRDAIREALS